MMGLPGNALLLRNQNIRVHMLYIVSRPCIACWSKCHSLCVARSFLIDGLVVFCSSSCFCANIYLVAELWILGHLLPFPA